MEPSETYFRNRASSSPDDNACISGQRHQQVSCVAHAAWDNDGSRPIQRGHFIGRDDTHNQASRIYGLFRCDSRGWAATAAYDRYAEPSQ